MYAFDNVEDGAARVALLAGGTGDDSVAGEASVLSGGEGDDNMSTYTNQSGSPRVVHCGDGVDFVTSFARDDVFDQDCETVQMFLNADNGSTLEGTRYDDIVTGGFGTETINTLAGNDEVNAGVGSDKVNLGAGNDYFENWGSHNQGDQDSVTCGDGYDQAYVYRADIVAADCEFLDYRD